MSRTEKGAHGETERDTNGRNVVPSQLTSHLTSAWKAKISLEVYSKLYGTSVESRRRHSKIRNLKFFYSAEIFRLAKLSKYRLFVKKFEEENFSP